MCTVPKFKTMCFSWWFVSSLLPPLSLGDRGRQSLACKHPLCSPQAGQKRNLRALMGNLSLSSGKETEQALDIDYVPLGFSSVCWF